MLLRVNLVLMFSFTSCLVDVAWQVGRFCFSFFEFVLSFSQHLHLTLVQLHNDSLTLLFTYQVCLLLQAVENFSPKQAQAASASSSPASASGNLPVVLGLASLPLGESVVCGIQEIVSCQEFYVNQKEAEDNLNMLREKLNSFCGELAEEQPEAVQQVSKGNHVLVQFSADNEWYRGRVEQVSEDGKKCRVFFVDYGNAEDKDVASLKALPPNFKQIPAQAITCKLAGVPPPVPEEVELRFKSSCLQTEVNIKAVGKQDDERYFVEVSTLDNRSITGILGIQSGRKGAQRKLDSSRQPSTSDESRPTSEGLVTCALAAANTPTPVSNQKSPRQVSASPPCADVHVPLRRDCLQQELFHSQEIMITHVVNPHHFYVMTTDQYCECLHSLLLYCSPLGQFITL